MRVIDRLVPWLIGAFVLTVALAGVYGGLQQLNRSSADDAGERLVSQIVSAGQTNGSGGRVDLATSLQPFYVVYDRSAHPVAGDGYLDGRLGAVPSGVVATAFATGTDRVTWEPQSGLRFATVAQRQGDQVIVAGQSLQPVENRIDHLGALLLAGWGAAILVLIVGAALHLWLATRLTPGGPGPRPGPGPGPRSVSPELR
jgi:hypothetical protein